MVSRIRHVLAAVVLAALLGGLLVTTSATGSGAQDQFVFNGRGWGHGAGMSQWGAFARAQAGQNAAQILGFYYEGTQVESRPQVNDLRIHLARTGSSAFVPEGVNRISIDGETLTRPASGARISVGITPTGWNISGPEDFCGGECTGNQVNIHFATGTSVAVGASGRSYFHGRITLTRASATEMYVVLDSLSMQDYLYGIAEVPTSWPAEAQRAQAIAARTYALEAAQRRRAAPSWTNPWDLYASTLDQAYVGDTREKAPSAGPWIAAVNATENLVSTFNGSPIQAFYSSSNGGHTERTSVVFANDLPYITAKPDSFDPQSDPNANWTRTYSAADLSRLLATRSDTDVGTVTSISIGGPLGASGRVNNATVTISGSGGTKTVSGGRLMGVINSAVISEGGGLDRQLLSSLFTVGGSSSGNSAPLGVLDAVRVVGNDVRALGWALDADTGNPIDVHIYVNSVGHARVANTHRPDVGAAFGLGDNRGFDVTVPAGPGNHTVCAYAIDHPTKANNPLLGCRTVTVSPNAAPVGAFDVVQPGPNGLQVLGWALELGRREPIDVHIYVNGVGYARKADTARPDVGAIFGLGDNHGFNTVVPAGSGTQTVCAYAIDHETKANNPLLGCKQVNG